MIKIGENREPTPYTVDKNIERVTKFLAFIRAHPEMKEWDVVCGFSALTSIDLLTIKQYIIFAKTNSNSNH